MIAPKGAALEGQLSFEYVLAHEVFHCFQYGLYDGSRPGWLIEGMADWAGIKATGFQQGSHYRNYLKTPRKHLFARGYDASGFWGHAEEVGGVGSLWAKIPAILAAPAYERRVRPRRRGRARLHDDVGVGAWRLRAPGPRGSRGGRTPCPPPRCRSRAAPSPATRCCPRRTSRPRPTRSWPTRRGRSSRCSATRASCARRPTTRTSGSSAARAAATAGSASGSASAPTGASRTIPANEQVDAGGARARAHRRALPGKGQVAYHSLNEFCTRKPDPPAARPSPTATRT